ncbi:proline iminopeptidase [Pyrenophora tritici-repentis]|uniref:Abhydrolase-1 multi-domain protein n=2 Tax=Pyrenophora tritici-repentis TaxID=45151 RepID=A0A2W1EXJ7_9PLEO|nr:proline iminopeptidase [Pyrenophora tritici-repentis Pt-1C-BFP]KAA8622706.1 Proline iminopeptidase [Pyrenophora tritici-repentis]EDU45717.1 proline iminopeptidase [Pyrenophora tritici-repentis Pt-1C-BFP]KAF7451695.1 Proline iminopeptidase [Pyrenophora tritici-repentis]KAF7575192.1 Abhydrolase-1 multi-domain protein [Pyrenophora tritici-repentis]KAG9386050.1 Proline iminopeptidase [Pyrenophora tritici-repentis]
MIQAAKILEQRSHLIPGKLRVTEHFFQVPRDYSNPSAGTIQLFARSALKVEKPADYVPSIYLDRSKKQIPWLIYLQGGPGFECRPPQNVSWTNAILDKGYQVLLLDQRGTGLSNAISQSSLQLRGDEKVQAEYMKSFRADSIVKDCEAVRKALTADYPEEKKKWSIMGQSFGGFCCATYLSFYPEGVKEAFLFGGLPPLRDGPDDVYERLYARVKSRNEGYYKKYPEDIERVKRIVKLLSRFGDTTVRVQGGEGFLSARRFLQLGIYFGKHGGFDDVHDFVLRADTDLNQFGHLTRPTVLALEAAQSWDTNVIYALLHEPIYCQGTAANWSAERLLPKYPEFSLSRVDSDDPVFFTGEMIYPFMFDCYPELAKLKTVGMLLAEEKDWPELYDVDQLKKNEVPVYAAVYTDDMYVDFDLSVETANTIKGCKMFVTNMMYHNGISAKTDEVLKQIFTLRDDVID